VNDHSPDLAHEPGRVVSSIRNGPRDGGNARVKVLSEVACLIGSDAGKEVTRDNESGEPCGDGRGEHHVQVLIHVRVTVGDERIAKIIRIARVHGRVELLPEQREFVVHLSCQRRGDILVDDRPCSNVGDAGRDLDEVAAGAPSAHRRRRLEYAKCPDITNSWHSRS